MAPAKIGLNNGFLFTDVEIRTVLQSSQQMGKRHGNKHQEPLVAHSRWCGLSGLPEWDSLTTLQQQVCNFLETLPFSPVLTNSKVRISSPVCQLLQRCEAQKSQKVRWASTGRESKGSAGVTLSSTEKINRKIPNMGFYQQCGIYIQIIGNY